MRMYAETGVRGRAALPRLCRGEGGAGEAVPAAVPALLARLCYDQETRLMCRAAVAAGMEGGRRGGGAAALGISHGGGRKVGGWLRGQQGGGDNGVFEGSADGARISEDAWHSGSGRGVGS